MTAKPIHPVMGINVGNNNITERIEGEWKLA